MCDRAIWLRHGVVTGEGDPSELVDSYTEQMLGENVRTERRHRSAAAPARCRSSPSRLFVGDGETPVKRCRTGDNVRLRLHYQAEKAIPKPVFGIAIEQLGGTVVTSPCTRDVGSSPTRSTERATSTSTLADFPLLPGTYDIHTSVTDFNRAHIYDHVQTHLRIDVMTGKRYETGGVVTLAPRVEDLLTKVDATRRGLPSSPVRAATGDPGVGAAISPNVLPPDELERRMSAARASQDSSGCRRGSGVIADPRGSSRPAASALVDRRPAGDPAGSGTSWARRVRDEANGAPCHLVVRRAAVERPARGRRRDRPLRV